MSCSNVRAVFFVMAFRIEKKIELNRNVSSSFFTWQLKNVYIIKRGQRLFGFEECKSLFVYVLFVVLFFLIVVTITFVHVFIFWYIVR